LAILAYRRHFAVASVEYIINVTHSPSKTCLTNFRPPELSKDDMISEDLHTVVAIGGKIHEAAPEMWKRAHEQGGHALLRAKLALLLQAARQRFDVSAFNIIQVRGFVIGLCLMMQAVRSCQLVDSGCLMMQDVSSCTDGGSGLFIPHFHTLSNVVV